MAIEYIQVKAMSRSNGYNALASAAYRSNSKLYDKQLGQTFDYTNKGDCVYANVLLPVTANIKNYQDNNHPFKDRETLWNKVEEVENSHNRSATARVAYELQIALPKELTTEQNTKLINEFITKQYVNKFNIAADVCIHDKGDNNPHAHVMLTTRKIEGVELSKTKDRNILPPVKQGMGQAFSKVDGIGKKYRDFQNQFFKENNIELVVDQNRIVPNIHMNRSRVDGGFYKKDLEENRERNIANADFISKDHNDIIKVLAYRQSTFTRADIESLIYKCTVSSPNRDEVFKKTLDKVLSSDKLMNLGYSTAGRITYTTQENYTNDLDLLRIANDLEGKKSFNISSKIIDKISKETGLREEQEQAIRFISQGGDLSCLVGYAGAGKTYTMNALRKVYEEKNIKVYGTSISGKAVQGLQDEAGIESRTIASILQDIKSGNIQNLPEKGSSLIVDEAGMVGMDEMLSLVKLSKERNLKLVLVGDPKQLEAISKGNPFKAILEQTNFAVMKDITRQVDAADKQATVYLGEGKTGLAIDHYYDKGNVHIQSKEQNSQAIIDRYDSYLDKTYFCKKEQIEKSYTIQDTMMLAYTRADVFLLNNKAREALLNRNLIEAGKEIIVSVNGQSFTKQFSAGERILFLQNKVLESGEPVKNGLFAQIKHIEGNNITVITNEDKPREITFDATTYNNFDYGYAATVHKSQGATVLNTINYVSDSNWNSHLTYVAMTRHKHNMDLYVDNNVYKDKDLLRKGLSTRSAKEFNVLDFVEKKESNKIMSTIRRYMNLGDKYDLTNEVLDTNSKFAVVAELADVTKQVGREYYKLVDESPNNILSDDSQSLLQSKYFYRNELAFKVASNYDELVNAIDENGLDQVKVLRWSQDYLAEKNFNKFIESNNSLYKGSIAEVINESARGRMLLSQHDKWQDYHLSLSRYKALELIKDKKVSREDIKLVEKYLAGRDLGYSYYKKTQAEYFGKDEQRHLAQVEKYQSLSNQVNKANDKLALDIANNMAKHKAILETKYSGNMLESVIENINRQAEYQRKREAVIDYLHATGKVKEDFAYMIAENGKEYARFVAEVKADWKEINQHAQPGRLAAWREGLGYNVREIFDSIHDYKTTEINLAKLMSNSKFENRSEAEKAEISKLVIERNEKAHNLLYRTGLAKFQDDAGFLSRVYPNINIEKVIKHDKLYREGLLAQQLVNRYKDIITKSPESLEINELAHQITSRYAAHAKYINEAGLNPSDLNRRSRYYQFEIANKAFTGIDKRIHKELSDYVISKEKANTAWMQYKLSNDDTNKLVAQELSLVRDEYAYIVSKSLGQNISSSAYAEFTNKQVDLHQLLKSAKEHELTVKLKQYSNLEPGSKESIILAKEISNNYSKGNVYYRLERLDVDKKAFYTDIKVFDRQLQENKEFANANASFTLYKEAAEADLMDWKGKLATDILSDSKNLRFIERAGLDYNKLNIDSLEYKLDNYIPSKDARVVERLDFNRINEEFKKDLNNYQHVFGARGKETEKTIIFGDHVISKVGNNAGKWWDSRLERYREPVDGVMKLHGTRHSVTGENYAEYTAKIAGVPADQVRIKEVIDPVRRDLEFALDDFKEKVQKLEAVEMLWKNTEALEGSIADRYLKEHRGITDTSSLEMRYLPKGKDIMLSDGTIKENKIPMLVVPGYDSKGKLVSAQRVYLDEETAGKNKFMENPKLSMGLVAGSGGLVQKGTSDRVYIVEGPETGASIALADKEASVYCSFGLSNLSKLDRLIKANDYKEVILAADNDGKGSNAEKLTKEAQQELESKGVKLKVIEPKALEGLAKTDWNDVLKEKGVKEIQQQLNITKEPELTKEHQYAQKLLDKIDDISRRIDVLSKKSKLYESKVILSKLSEEKQKEIKLAYAAVPVFEKQREKLLKQFAENRHIIPGDMKQLDQYKNIDKQAQEYQRLALANKDKSFDKSKGFERD